MSNFDFLSDVQGPELFPASMGTGGGPPAFAMPQQQLLQRQHYRDEKSNADLGIQPEAETQYSPKAMVPSSLGSREEGGEAFIRGRWIATQLGHRLSSFGEEIDVKLACLTWNVNGKNVAAQEVDLRPWLAEAVDLYAIGVQEMVDLTAVNVVADGKSAKRAEEWRRILDKALGDVGKYELVAQRHMVGVLLCIYAVSRQPGVSFGAWACSEICSSTAGCGVMGMLGNKGGVSIRLRALDTTLCFVCAHLAAHRDNVEGRNADFSAIVAKTEFKVAEARGTWRSSFLASSDALLMRDKTYLVFSETDASIDEEEHSLSARLSPSRVSNNVPSFAGVSGGTAPMQQQAITPAAAGRETLRIEEHDVVFFLGDLNYRVHSSIDLSECVSRAEANDWMFLRSNDQLNMERASGRVFQGYHEAPLDFPVTYKYQPGTLLLEKRPDKKLRAPAWCDRVLWRSPADPNRVKILAYESVPELLASDHKPVRALFNTTLLKIHRAKRRSIKAEVVQRLFASTAAAQRSADLQFKVDGAEEPAARGSTIIPIDLGDVRYGLLSQKSITVSNAPNTKLAHWRFVQPTGRARDVAHDFWPSARSWMHVEPWFGTLFPGESIKITLSALVESRDAKHLNAGTGAISDALYFSCGRSAPQVLFKVRGNWVPSTWGRSLDELCVRTNPATRAPHLSTTTTIPVPKEIWRLIDALHSKGRDVPHLFFIPGKSDEVHSIRSAIDGDLTLPPHVSPYSLADALVSFLAALAEPVLPGHVLPTSELSSDENDRRQWARDLFTSLSPAAYNTFLYCLALFRDLLLRSKSNLLTPAKLAAVICNCMLPQNAPTYAPLRGSLVAGTGTAFDHYDRFPSIYSANLNFLPTFRPGYPPDVPPAPPAAPNEVTQQRHYMSSAIQYLLTTTSEL